MREEIEDAPLVRFLSCLKSLLRHRDGRAWPRPYMHHRRYQRKNCH